MCALTQYTYMYTIYVWEAIPKWNNLQIPNPTPPPPHGMCGVRWPWVAISCSPCACGVLCGVHSMRFCVWCPSLVHRVCVVCCVVLATC